VPGLDELAVASETGVRIGRTREFAGARANRATPEPIGASRRYNGSPVPCAPRCLKQ
jgi:hypothetical protein